MYIYKVLAYSRHPRRNYVRNSKNKNILCLAGLILDDFPEIKFFIKYKATLAHVEFCMQCKKTYKLC